MIRCIRFRPYIKNTLQGFADLELTRVGLVIRDCCWHRHKGGKEWISFPARPYEGPDGNTAWQSLIEFAESARDAREQFQRQALAAVHAVADERNANDA
jgi:hypothetical protein